jgi:hypothetical protein
MTVAASLREAREQFRVFSTRRPHAAGCSEGRVSFRAESQDLQLPVDASE